MSVNTEGNPETPRERMRYEFDGRRKIARLKGRLNLAAETTLCLP